MHNRIIYRKDKKIRDWIVYLVSLALMLEILFCVLHRNEVPHVYAKDLQCSFALRVNQSLYPERSSEQPQDQRKEVLLRRGDEVLLSGKLSRDLPKTAFINMHVLYSAVEVFVGKEKIYSYGVERQKKRLPLGAGYHSVPLPKGYGGQQIRIRLIPSASYKFSYILQELSLGEKDLLSLRNIHNNAFSFLTAVFLITFGTVLFLIFIFFFLLGSQEPAAVAYLSVFTFCMGLWGLCSINFIQIFSDDVMLNSYVEFFSFYALFPAWLFVVADLKRDRRSDRIFLLGKVFFSLFYVTVAALQLMHIQNYEFFLLPYQLCCLFSMIVVVRVLMNQFRMQMAHEKVLCIGTILVAFVIFIQILLYNIGKYLLLSNVYRKSFAFYLHMLIIVGTLVVSYGIRFFGNRASKRERELLKKMAYQDSLTGLGNRQSGMLRLLEYEKDRQHYRLLLYDLNNLKAVNDLCGHSKGDRMLKIFSSMLKRVFDQGETLIRIGGDEFLVIKPIEAAETEEEWKEKFRETLQGFNRRHPEEIPIEVAYGTASTYELRTFSNEEILKRADERMYENKSLVKLGLKEQLE